MHQEFKQIIKDLKRVKQEENLATLDDNMLFDGAVRIYNSILINDRLQKNMQERQQTLLPITEKQIHLLQKLKYTGRTDLTKSEATKIIQQLLDKQKKNVPPTVQKNYRF